MTRRLFVGSIVGHGRVNESNCLAVGLGPERTRRASQSRVRVSATHTWDKRPSIAVRLKRRARFSQVPRWLLSTISPPHFSCPISPHTSTKWSSKLLVRTSLILPRDHCLKSTADVSLAAFGRKEIEIAEVCERLGNCDVCWLTGTLVFSMRCQDSCTSGTRLAKSRCP